MHGPRLAQVKLSLDISTPNQPRPYAVVLSKLIGTSDRKSHTTSIENKYEVKGYC